MSVCVCVCVCVSACVFITRNCLHKNWCGGWEVQTQGAACRFQSESETWEPGTPVVRGPVLVRVWRQETSAPAQRQSGGGREVSLPLPFCSSQAFNKVGEANLRWRGPSALLGLPIQTWMSSRITLTDRLECGTNYLCSRSSVKLTCEVSTHRWTFLYCSAIKLWEMPLHVSDCGSGHVALAFIVLG